MVRPLWTVTAVILAALLSAGCVPPRQSPDTPATPAARRINYEAYSVRPGDTLFSIGKQFGVPWAKIYEANQGTDVNNLEVGQILYIPIHEATGPRTSPQPEPALQLSDRIISVPREHLHKGKPVSPYWWPTSGAVSRRFEENVRGLPEPGIGLSAPAGTEVCTVAPGTVLCSVPEGLGHRQGWGNVLCVRHSGGIVSWYGQLGRILVKDGQKVDKGDRIGTVGESGAASRPELALRLYANERPVDPLKYLP